MAAVNAKRMTIEPPWRSAVAPDTTDVHPDAARPVLRRKGAVRVAAGPADGGGRGWDGRAPGIFRTAFVGSQGERASLAAERPQEPKHSFLAEPWQPPVVEHRHRGQDDAAVG